MKTLLVLAHPLETSLNARLARSARTALESQGHSVRFLDLYRDGFDPRLTTEERAAYYTADFKDTAGLSDLDGLVLVFPTWWFGLPAILKGWIDRSFLPGLAYDHDSALGTLKPKLHRLSHVCAITTLGAPAFYDRFLIRQPVKRSLKWGLVKPVAPKADFRMHALYSAEKVTEARLSEFEDRMDRALYRQFGTDPT